MVVPSSPGASMDATARAYGGWLAEKLGVNVVIDNRAGAGTTLGHALAAKALPDGYTVLLGASSGLVVGPALGMKVSYDPVKDFAPVGVNVYVPFVLVVHPALPASNVKELVERRSPERSTSPRPGPERPTISAWSCSCR
jgi:tripartite-type tricarboxylate transporter receptor subunit TctC